MKNEGMLSKDAKQSSMAEIIQILKVTWESISNEKYSDFALNTP